MNPTTTRLAVIYECPDHENPLPRRAPMPGPQPVLSTHRHRRSLPLPRPYCDEPVAISDLAEPTTPTTSQAVTMTT